MYFTCINSTKCVHTYLRKVVLWCSSSSGTRYKVQVRYKVQKVQTSQQHVYLYEDNEQRIQTIHIFYSRSSASLDLARMSCTYMLCKQSMWSFMCNARPLWFVWQLWQKHVDRLLALALPSSSRYHFSFAPQFCTHLLSLPPSPPPYPTPSNNNHTSLLASISAFASSILLSKS